MKIPFNKPVLVGNEFHYISEALHSMHISGDGVFTHRCHALLKELTGVSKALLTTSCTHALEMAALLLDIESGDEVIVPSFTFVSTANAFALRGARLVFADIRPDTLNLDENELEKLITPHTKAIVPVHYAGVACEMEAILQIAAPRGIAVIEDNAHGLFGAYKNAPLGSFGMMATQSFHETKNISCGEGGALLINDPALVERAEIIREKGTNRAQFFRGQVAKYTWVDLGSSYLPSEILAAFLWAQLEAREQIQTQRRRIWEYYARHLPEVLGELPIRLPYVPPHCQQAYHMFYLLMPSLEARQSFIAHLAERGICSVFHYQPLHLSKMGKYFGGRQGDCPITEQASDRLLRLPFYNELNEEQQNYIIGAIQEFCG